jgi:hypothetical protein
MVEAGGSLSIYVVPFWGSALSIKAVHQQWASFDSRGKAGLGDYYGSMGHKKAESLFFVLVLDDQFVFAVSLF